MILAFLDSPVQLMIVMIVVLIVFGPQKIPEIGQQLGRAMRELRRATQDFSSSLNLDDDKDKYNSSYDPPRYDSYGNPYSVSSTYTVPESDVWQSVESETTPQNAIAASEPPRGDFAAAAFSDSTADYGVAPASDEPKRN